MLACFPSSAKSCGVSYEGCGMDPSGIHARMLRLQGTQLSSANSCFYPPAAHGNLKSSISFTDRNSARDGPNRAEPGAFDSGCCGGQRVVRSECGPQTASRLPDRWNESGTTILNPPAKTEVKPQKHYVVQKGDTLYRIAQFFDTTVELLMLENGIADPTTLQIGQKLAIPPSREDIADWIKNRDNRVIKELEVTLTAYTAGYESTGKTPSHPAYGITSSGTRVKENLTIAVDPEVIPMGSLVYIEGIGIRRAEDTGSAIKGSRIDVYIPDLKEALEFGVKKNVKVYVLGEKNRPVRIASSHR